MKSQLSALSVSEDAEELYRRVLRHVPAELSSHAARLGWPRARAAAALKTLVDRELVRITPEDEIRAEHPRIALERLIDREWEMLDRRRQELSESRSLIASYLADHRVGLSSPQVAHPAWEGVSSEAAAGMVEHLFRTTTGSVLQMTMTVQAGPGTDPDVLEAALHSWSAADRHMRTIYPQHLTGQPGFRVWQEAFAAAGEEQRLHPVVPTEFAVFGDAVVVAQERWGQIESDYVVIRDGMLVSAFTALFERFWAESVPVHVPGSDRDDLALVKCLAMGMKDEAIARHLGMSLRTTRRRIATLMEDLGAETRFQLGAQAQARGLLR